MSADNWMVCPVCRKAHDAKAAKALEKATKQYGKVSVGKYDADLRDARNLSAEELPSEFREDYEIRISADGVFTVSYSGYCRTCDAKFVFKHECDADFAKKIDQ